MKLNNKGFAITAVLYGLLILFVIFVSMYLLILSVKKDRVDTLVNDIEENYANSLKSVKLIDHITDLYLNNKDKVVKNNNIEYQYAESVNLMNDRLGGTTEDYDAGNIRYYGENPNNYIDIGDRDSFGNVILYRIIGVFKDMELSDGTKQNLVKVIRNESMETCAWDNKINGIGSSTSDVGSNDWSDSRLMMLLNPGYDEYSSTNPLKDTSGYIIYGYEGSLYWNSRNGTCYEGESNATKDCNFINSGLSTNAQNKIESVVWKLGGWNSPSIYANEIYTYERGTEVYEGRTTEWMGKVALMSTSDYGYATDMNYCSEILDNYSANGCYNNDWLLKEVEWLLTPRSDTSRGVYYLDSGTLSLILGNNVSNQLSFRPAFYLNNNLEIAIGDGSILNPYKIKDN